VGQMGLLIHNIHNVQTTFNYFDLAPKQKQRSIKWETRAKEREKEEKALGLEYTWTDFWDPIV
jgi:hypothetical protein